jgi:flagellar biosynthesis anti-sigma factor FlgM
MKVDDPKLTGMTSSQVGGAQAPDAAGVRQKKHEGGSGSRDEVSLSDLGAKLRELDSESPQLAERLAQLAADVQAGRYRVDPMQVSDRIIDDAMSSDDALSSEAEK